MKPLHVIFYALFVSLIGSLNLLNANEETIMDSRPTVEIETNLGTFEVALRPDIAPKATENFLTHAKNGYYNNLIFHRVISGFMIQGGDPTGTGRGGQSIWKSPFEDEVTDSLKFNHPGILAMANAGPKTNGSQFFITTASTPWLNKKHTIFGEVVQGYDVIKKIEGVATNGENRPLQEVKILRMSVKVDQPNKL